MKPSSAAACLFAACTSLGALACGSDAEDPGASNGGSDGAQGGSGQGGSGNAGSGAGGAGGGGVPTTPLRFATFNAEKFFNDVFDSEPGISGEGEVTPTSDAWETELRATVELLNLLDADVVVFQEVENQATLEELAARPGLNRRYEHVRVVQGNNTNLGGIDVGVMSVLPIDQFISHKDDRFTRLDDPNSEEYRFTRDCIEVHVSFEGRPFVLLGVHFKARSNDDPDRRLAEAQRTRQILDGLLTENPERGVAVLGDFNDGPSSDPLQALYGDPALCRCSGPRIGGVVQYLPEGDRWTLFSSSNRTHVDDIVISPRLEEWLVRDSVRVLHDADLPENLRSLSDHSPVVATFAVPDPT